MLDKQGKCDLLTYNTPHYRKQKGHRLLLSAALLFGVIPLRPEYYS